MKNGKRATKNLDPIYLGMFKSVDDYKKQSIATKVMKGIDVLLATYRR